MNAKDEFLVTTKHEKIIGVDVSIGNVKLDTSLNPGFSEIEYENFLKLIDIEYDDGYGSQKLVGIIICENGVWFERAEYDGSEWWEKHEYPLLENYFDKEIVLKYERNQKYIKINGDEK